MIEEKLMRGLLAKWDKVPARPGQKSECVDVVILDFCQISNSNTSETRPVAIIQDLSDNNRLRYAELKYLTIQGKADSLASN